MTRQRIVQGGPPAELNGFPIRTCNDDLYRAARLSPWWFCQDLDCRFDLAVGCTNGTMYAGTDQITGVLETIGTEMVGSTIERRFLTERFVWSLRYERPLELADMTADAAVGFQVTNELTTMVPYAVPQQWAAAFDADGFDGISYRTRFNTGPTTTGVAVFDIAGAHPDWPATNLGTAAAPATIEALADRHVTVADPPALGELTVL